MVIEKLKSVHLVFSLICADPDRVDSADGDASEREKDAQSAHGLDRRAGNRGGLLIVVRYQADAETHGNQSVDGHPRDGLLVEEEVDDCDDGGQEDTSDLVEGDGGDLEGDVHADNVHRHCNGQRKHVHDGDLARLEHANGGAREEVERGCCDEEVEGCEGGLTLREGFVAEDGFITEDLLKKKTMMISSQLVLMWVYSVCCFEGT